jgi:hypothetical protein
MKQRVEDFYSALEDMGRLALWRRVEALYYGRDADSAASSHRVTAAGEQGEALHLRSNHFRSVLKHSLTLTTGTRPAITAKAENSDYRSSSQRKLAESIIQHHMTRGDLEDALVRAAEYAHTHGEGYIVQVWDEDSGEMFGVDERIALEDMPAVEDYQRQLAEWQQGTDEALVRGQEPPPEPEPPDVTPESRVVYDGDVVYHVPHPVDVVRDIHMERADRQRWYIIRRRVDRWDLAARFPEDREHILDTSGDDDKWARIGLQRWESVRTPEDQVTVFELYHAPCHQLPWGRRAIMAGEKVIEGSVQQLRYRSLPVHPMYPAIEGTTPFGYAPAFDLVSLQNAYDSVLSGFLTSVDALGFMNIYVPDGASVDVNDLGGGVRLFSGPQQPMPMKLLEGVQDNEKIMEYFRREIELISGVNSVARGEPGALTAGVSLAFTHAMAIQSNSGIQRSYSRLVESVCTSLIEIYQVHATTKRVVEIAGVKNTGKAREFTGEDLQSVRRVSVDLGNPIMRSAAGRMEIAEKLVSHPTAPIGPDQFLEVIATGRLDPVTEAPDAEAGLVALENERLMDGQPTPTLKTDDHARHIREHLVLLMDPEIRLQDELAAHILRHITEHVQLAQQVQAQEPALAVLTGQVGPNKPPLPMPDQQGPEGGPPPGPGGPGGPPGPGGPEQPPQDPRFAPMPGVDGSPQAAGIQRPRMPDLPDGAQLPPDVAAAARGAGVAV